MNTSESNITAAANIMAGLLASGHYTAFADPDGTNEPRVLWWDAGPDWKADGYESRLVSHVVDDTMALLRALEFRIATEEKMGARSVTNATSAP